MDTQRNGRISNAKYKLTGQCNSYNNVYQVWNFNIDNFEAIVENETI